MPIMLELQKRKEDYYFVHTGQHSLQKACEEFGVNKPYIILSKEPEKETKFLSKINKFSLFWFFSMILKIKRTVNKLSPSYVVYHGDTMSTTAAAIGSSKLFNFHKKWKSIHLEAGLRSGRIFEPFPEEIARRISDLFSDILLAVSEDTQKLLIKQYPKKKVVNVGNTVVDSSLIIYEKARKNKKKINEEYVLVNLHRHENLKDEKRLSDIVKIVNTIKSDIIWPLHENTRHYLEKYGLLESLKNKKNIQLTPLVNYEDFIFLMANCKYLVTDGGSIQEESLVFKKPCIILRKATERQEGLKTGINFLTSLNVSKSQEIIKKLDNQEIPTKKFNNPYGEKGLSKKIVDLLLK
jgi:UDP-N-acetylglucosamine 2-epimerase (non-hydrolysing)